MELNNIELTAVQEIADKNHEVVVELTDLDLVMIGGGTGDVHFG
jgi:hypothetical protein